MPLDPRRRAFLEQFIDELLSDGYTVDEIRQYLLDAKVRHEAAQRKRRQIDEENTRRALASLASEP